MKKGNNSTAQLIGAKSFSRNGVLTGNDELVFFVVKPTNISVLSDISVGLKVKNLMYLLTAQPELEICCLDDQESFDDNKTYLHLKISLNLLACYRFCSSLKKFLFYLFLYRTHCCHYQF